MYNSTAGGIVDNGPGIVSSHLGMCGSDRCEYSVICTDDSTSKSKHVLDEAYIPNSSS